MAIETTDAYRALSEATLGDYLAGLSVMGQKLGGEPSDWKVSEVGDGNLNLVFIVEGPDGGIVVKQALPYVRLVGESWPLPLSRAHYEHMALTRQAGWAPGLVPEVYHYDQALALIIMQLLSPHIIMRRGMINAIEYPAFAEDITTFIANTLFFSSDLALTADLKKQAIGDFCANFALCKITEDLIFTEPYCTAENNRWTSPQLDLQVQALQADGDLKIAVSELKMQFMCNAQALIHGDLHTGSIMVTATQTQVIDPEFAFYGPMGFDIGAVLANLLLNYYSQDGYTSDDEPRDQYQEWVLSQVGAVWNGFATKFLTLWNAQRAGDGYPAALFDHDESVRSAAQSRFIRRVFVDTLGFAGAKMIRRLIGLAHNIDLEWIEDPDRRAACESRGLALGRELIVCREQIESVDGLIQLARDVKNR